MNARHDHTREFPAVKMDDTNGLHPWLGRAIMVCLVLTMIFVAKAHALTPRDADRYARPVTRAQALAHGHQSVAYRKWVIQTVWGRHARLGLRIAFCESGYRTHAVDYLYHTHKGLFMLGTPERRKYGQTTMGAWDEVRAGYKLFQDRHSQPWDASQTCWKKG